MLWTSQRPKPAMTPGSDLWSQKLFLCDIWYLTFLFRSSTALDSCLQSDLSNLSCTRSWTRILKDCFDHVPPTTTSCSINFHGSLSPSEQIWTFFSSPGPVLKRFLACLWSSQTGLLTSC